jgi:hypothetical protein
MPYGWYRALRELQPKSRALAGAVLIGLVPESISIYAYFMNETLLLALLGFCFWLTLRARRKRTRKAFALAALVWFSAAFTRVIALPMALGCLAWLWTTQPQRSSKALIGAAIALLFAIPAGLHARDKLGFFAPFGNLYINEIYSAAGTREIAINYGPDGSYHFGCPSFYNPTFYPWSTWTTDREGVVSVVIDLTQGRAVWVAEKHRAVEQRTFPRWRQRWEDLQYLAFGQSWPNSDRNSLFGWLTLWTRWLWAPLIALVTWGVWQRRYHGVAFVLPACGLGTLALLLMQGEAAMEARYRQPIDAILICSALLFASRGDRRAAAGRSPLPAGISTT